MLEPALSRTGPAPGFWRSLRFGRYFRRGKAAGSPGAGEPPRGPHRDKSPAGNKRGEEQQNDWGATGRRPRRSLKLAPPDRLRGEGFSFARLTPRAPGGGFGAAAPHTGTRTHSAESPGAGEPPRGPHRAKALRGTRGGRGGQPPSGGRTGQGMLLTGRGGKGG